MEVEQWLGSDNKLGIDIWRKKYCYNGESFEQWLDRVSDGNDDIRQMIVNKEFLFGGRILANRGLWKTGFKATLSNCYVVEPPKDSIESIFETAGKLARIFSYGGGCGIDISKLAPKGAKINNTALETSGAVSFTDLFAMVTSLIGQHGRRGALMLSISCEHPDLEDFMAVKTDVNRATKANMSIRVTDKFMNAVKSKETFVQTFRRPETDSVTIKNLNAREFFRKMCYANWDFGEPGCLYWDRIESWNLLSEFPNYHYAGTNPCAEEPLPAGGSCLLGSINLAAFVNNRFEEERFRRAIDVCITGLNEVLDEGLPLHPLKEQIELATNWRQIGLGVMGFADMLIKLQLTYGSDEALKFCDKIGFIMADESIKQSAILARDNGAFPMCNIEQIMASPYFQLNTTEKTKELVKKYGLRNSQLLTIAPTGTLSTMLGVSGGIEPIFANFYRRKTVSLSGKDEYYKVYTPIVKEYIDKFKLTGEGDLPKFFVTAQELNFRQRLLQQSTWQKHIDASISSTVNLPNDFPEKDVYDLYMFAWETGCKGVTVFRDGCQRVGILDREEGGQHPEERSVRKKRGFVENVADDVIGKKRKLITGCGSLHCTAFFNPHTGDLAEVYLNKGSTGGCNNFMIGLSRMISLAARSGCNIEDVVDQLESCGSCSSYAVRTFTKNDTSRGSCCPMAVGYALKDMHKEMQREIDQTLFTSIQKSDESKLNDSCPECGEKLEKQGGCNICKSCGWTRCD